MKSKMRSNIKNNYQLSLITVAIINCLSIGVASADDIIGKIDTNTTSIEGYTVKAVNLATGTTREVKLSEDGRYRLAKMPSGLYKVSVMKNGRVVAEDNARASLGSNSVKNFELVVDDIEVIQVTGNSVAMVDVTSSDSGLTISETELERLPIARNITSVALLAPGVVQGDSAFGNTASFGGSSVAENVCYINGMEVTNTRQGLGCGELPFEFYNEFQVKTGGYSAKYGRATGGAINATAKKGTNEWEFAGTANYTPDFLRSEGSYSRGNGGVGDIFRDTRHNEYDKTEFTLSVGGPIIEDKLFFYAIINPRDIKQSTVGGGDENTADDELNKRDSSGSDNLFWGATIDWDINDNNRLSYFGYSNRSDTTRDIYKYIINDSRVSVNDGGFKQKRGGETHSLKYTGYLTDNLILSAMVGTIETEYENIPSNLKCSTVVDQRESGGEKAVQCGQGGSFGENNDTNTQYSFDIEYTFNDHTITAGYEFQKRDSSRETSPVAGHSYTYYTLGAGNSIQGNNGVLFTNNGSTANDYVEDRIFDGGGSFSSDISAFYIEDKWQVTEDLTLNIGARVDKFKNSGTTGKVLTEFTTDIAPRLGFSWDPTGDGTSKIYGTAGTYHLPVANNTIYRAAAGISDVTTHYTFNDFNTEDGTPVNPQPVNGTIENSSTVSSVVKIPEKAIFQAREADPFSKVEYILGYETAINDEYSISIKGTYRNVDSALDDYCGAYASPYCVLLNPGEDSSWYKDGHYYTAGTETTIIPELYDGSPDPDSLTVHRNRDQIMLPKGKNKYYALQTVVQFNEDNLRWSFSYSWSHSYGNFEGAVKSDIGQADPGVTQDFDFPALMDGAYGNLPNDRRHVFKFYGSYDITDNWTAGWNSTLASGRPLSAFGQGYPSTDRDIFGGYGDTFYLTNQDGSFTRNPRGTVGETPWLFKVDLSSSYSFEINDIDMKVSLDIFNVFDIQTATTINEHYEVTPGGYNKFYGTAYEWQTPRYARLGFEARF